MQKKQLASADEGFGDAREAELIAAVIEGDRNAFHDLYQQHCGRVYALCLRISGNQAMAEDLTQEVFIQVWRKIQDFRAESRFSTWLHSIAVNTTLAAIRKNKSWLSRIVSNDDNDTATEASAEMPADEHNLEYCIAKLPERARIVFVLRAIEGYRHEEIASKMNMAVGTSKSQYARARSLLQEWVEL
ncbi:MAG: sigma-70 family RNA polymerase sigma factor [Gammaproteobacteria bacterium]|nr:sigma-70 family RNA polymerase sigma factor [Gammaproteobacteria bacterium]